MTQNLEHEVNSLKIQLFHMEKKYEKEIENLNKQLQAYPPFRYFLNEGKNLHNDLTNLYDSITDVYNNEKDTDVVREMFTHAKIIRKNIYKTMSFEDFEKFLKEQVIILKNFHTIFDLDNFLLSFTPY